ncbi:cadherin domain-containing protein, partial [Caulobacter rhizosphaerae]
MYVKTLDSGDNTYLGDEGSPDFVDLIFGGDGDDYIAGGVDDDTLYGQNGDDTLHGGFNNDFLSGGAGADWLYGDTGDDTVFGGTGADRLFGGRGTDYLSGEDGDDTFYVDSADGVFFDTYNGGAGFDTIMASSTIYAEAIYGVEKIDIGGLTSTELQFSAADTTVDLTGVNTTALVIIRTGAGADHLIDNDSSHVLFGDDGADVLIARGGDDLLLGGAGDDDLDGGDGEDTFYFLGTSGGFDRISGGAGVEDTITVGDGAGGMAGDGTVIGLSSVGGIEVISAGGFLNVVIAGDATDNVFDLSTTLLVGIGSINGGDGSDWIVGSMSSSDVINGDAGNDFLAGGDGDDLLDGGTGDDTAFFLGNETDYSVVTVGGVTTVTDLRDPALTLEFDGQDTLTNVEFLLFADALVTIGAPSNVAPSDPVDVNAAANAISEDTVNGAVVGGLTLSSTDTAGDSRVYQLVDDAGGRFAINAATGVVSVANAALIDYETATSHDIQVRVFDGLAYSATVTFTINVTDFLENVTYTGTSGADTKAADTNARWTMSGLAGADVLTGAGKDDVLIGGAGDDTLNGGAGADLFLFDGTGEGFDAIVGGADADTIRAESDGTVIGLRSLSGVETISAGGHANVSIAGSAGADTLDLSAVVLDGITAPIDLGAGADTFTGTADADLVIGGTGADTLNGGAGADIFLVNTFTVEADTYNGGGGVDQILATADNVVIGLKSSGLSGIELISSGGFANVVVAGGATGDILNFTGVALDGVAEIQGGAGADTITGSSGVDVIDGGNDGDTIHGGAGDDIIIGGRVSGNSGNDLLYGDDGDDTFLFFVNPQVDSYYGGNGWDKIQAGQAGVQLNIGLGPSVSATLQVEEISAGGFTGVSIALQDRYTGSSWLGQTLDFSAVKLTGIAYLAGTLGADNIITGADDDTVVGGDSADVIQTGAGADYLRGDAGNDTLRGGLGNDTLIGGVGDDSSFGDDGDDVFSFTGTGLGYDAVTGGAGDDVITALANGTVIGLRSFSEIETITAGGFTGVSILGSTGADLLDFSTVSVVGISTFNAGAGADILIGTAAADTILGGDGDDILAGGDGDDVFQFTGTTNGADA